MNSWTECALWMNKSQLWPQSLKFANDVSDAYDYYDLFPRYLGIISAKRNKNFSFSDLSKNDSIENRIPYKMSISSMYLV